MATVRIGDVLSFARPEDWTYTPDDRQQKVEIINGVAIQDFGHIEAGDTMKEHSGLSESTFTDSLNQPIVPSATTDALPSFTEIVTNSSKVADLSTKTEALSRTSAKPSGNSIVTPSTSTIPERSG